jgi:hypothetical protein
MTTPPTPQPTSLAGALKASLAAAMQAPHQPERPIPCPNCSATLYTHHHTECPRYGTEPPWEPIGSDWQFGRDDSVSLAQNRSEPQ